MGASTYRNAVQSYPMDPLSPLFARFELTARVFYAGTLCGAHTFDERPGLGYLHMLRAGHLVVTQSGASPILIAEPSLLFYPRPCQHVFAVDDPTGASLVCASIEFGAGTGNPLLRGLPDLLLVPLAQIPGIEPALAMLFGEAFGERSGRQGAVDRLAEYVLILLMRHALDARIIEGGLLAGLADPRLAKAITAMHEHPETAWSLEELASAAGMSRARFAAHFRATIGATPLDYLTDWRISMAQTHLKRGKPLKVVAPMVGYTDHVALARVFQRRIGMSPAVWYGSRKADAEVADSG